MATEKKFWDTAGKGRKQCPHCQKFNSSRATKCNNPKCGKPLAQNPKRRSKGNIDLVRAVSVVKELGGINKTRAIIATIEEGLQKIKPLGDMQAAKETLDVLEELKSL